MLNIEDNTPTTRDCDERLYTFCERVLNIVPLQKLTGMSVAESFMTPFLLIARNGVTEKEPMKYLDSFLNKCISIVNIWIAHLKPIWKIQIKYLQFLKFS